MTKGNKEEEDMTGCISGSGKWEGGTVLFSGAMTRRSIPEKVSESAKKKNCEGFPLVFVIPDFLPFIPLL
jgi:hypothetical protein